ncbi:MAG: alpha/beta hydrolase [Ornithinimicrobium sp.]
MGTLDPDVARLIASIEAMFPVPPPDVTADQRRAGYRAAFAELLHPPPLAPFEGDVLDRGMETEVGEVPVRTYRPVTAQPGGDVVVLLPGGGWVIGDLETGDPTARALATGMDLTVITVDQRKAPEHPFPAGFDDALGVVQAVSERLQPRWLGVAGDSSGGNLAAGVALACALSGRQCDAQLLIYPALDPAMATPSHRALATGHLLERDVMRYYWASYLGEAPADDARVTPAAAGDDALAGVAPAVVATAEFDPLHDEGRGYAQRLLGLGVPTCHLPGPGLVHGWVDHVELVPAALAARDRAIAVFDALRPPQSRA